ncbi:hypothetical protein AMTR_s00157p00019390 [Amborella trichopoda]|uniref:Uncharacterized protein n=1 Tax=Amborella trichopoda TaxID=13333 RepID=W1PIM6_AMBTC|nr:hypothetical protein AMTR_s00157p00019390 [Amborella trichopoda]
MEEGSRFTDLEASGSIQGESSRHLTRAAIRARRELGESSTRPSGDSKGIECCASALGDVDGSAYSDDDTISPPVLLSDEERREQERERIRDAYE